jgi:hypothetical protein
MGRHVFDCSRLTECLQANPPRFPWLLVLGGMVIGAIGWAWLAILLIGR